MKVKRFDVVELKDKNRATIIDVKGKDEYLAEIVNAYGIILDKRVIKDAEIRAIVYSR